MLSMPIGITVASSVSKYNYNLLSTYNIETFACTIVVNALVSPNPIPTIVNTFIKSLSEAGAGRFVKTTKQISRPKGLGGRRTGGREGTNYNFERHCLGS